MKNKKVLFQIIALFGFALFIGIKWYRHNVVPELPFYAQDLKKEDGSLVKARSLKGKYILVSYFQSWCGDCARELPSIEKLQSDVGKEKINVVLVSDEDFVKINKFRNHFKSQLPFYQSINAFDKIGIHVFPTTYLLSPEGEILLSKLEGYDWASKDVLKLIQ